MTTSCAQRAARARAACPQIAPVADAGELRRVGGDLDLLVVATPARLHVPIARQALTRRITVVMDKPLAHAAPAAAPIDDLRAAGVPFTVFRTVAGTATAQLSPPHSTIRRTLGAIRRFRLGYERFHPGVDTRAHTSHMRGGLPSA